MQAVLLFCRAIYKTHFTIDNLLKILLLIAIIICAELTTLYYMLFLINLKITLVIKYNRTNHNMADITKQLKFYIVQKVKENIFNNTEIKKLLRKI